MTAYNGNLPRSDLRFTVPIISGTTTAISALGTSSTQVIGVDNNRTEIEFHNPNTISNDVIYVCQSVDVNGNALTAGPGNGGTYTIFPGASRVFRGQCQMAFNAAASAAGAGLTINSMSSPSS
jgi:hypothetical protein